MKTGDTMLVTGANGFIGHHVCAAFVATGWRVRGLVRSAGSVAPGIEPHIVADLLERGRIRSAMAGVDTVIHLAGRAHAMREHAADATTEFHRVNVEGTQLLLDEAIRANVTCLLLLSSVGAVCVASDTLVSEETPCSPTTPYGVTKLAAENLTLQLSRASGIRALILRAPLVYGPGMKGNPLRLYQLVARGTPIPLGSVSNRRSILYVGNLVAAMQTVLGDSTLGGEILFVTDGRDISTPEFIRAIARSLGLPARLVPFPLAGLRLAGRVGNVISRFVRFPLTSDTVDRLVASLPIDSSKLSRRTGFHPPYALEDGLQATAEWFHRQVHE